MTHKNSQLSYWVIKRANQCSPQIFQWPAIQKKNNWQVGPQWAQALILWVSIPFVFTHRFLSSFNQGFWIYIYKNKARVTVYFRSMQVFHHFVLLKKQVLQEKVADENSGCWGFWRTLSRCTQNIFTSTVHRLHIEYLGLSMLPHGLGPTEWHTHRPAKHPWADFAVDTIHCKKKLRFMFNGFNYIPQK